MNLPEEFIDQLKHLPDMDIELFMRSMEEPVPVSIRMNPFKTMQHQLEDRVLWATGSYYLSSRPSFTLDPLFHAGCYYVQEASSMFLEQIIRQYVKDPVFCLDLCAAPGGKSTHLLSALPEGSLLVSNETIRSRANILSENIVKWGNPYSVVTNDDPARFGCLPDFFDIIVADVPCSGEGMFRKDPDAIKEWSPARISLCADRQRRIVADAWKCLKPGGLLVYSTCTYNVEENEENISWIVDFLGAEPLDVSINPSWNICGSQKYSFPVYRFFPYKTRGEGFFISVLRKDGDCGENNIFPVKKRNSSVRSKIKVPAGIASWLNGSSENFYMDVENNSIVAYPELYRDVYSLINNNLRMIHAGVKIGEIKGKDIIPDHCLAMSASFNRDSFPSVEMDKETALAYLRKESFRDLSADLPAGFVVVSYENHPLGFIKNIGMRANNLYPQEWRIRKSI